MRSLMRATLGLMALAVVAQSARAEDAFPSHVVRLVVPAASGSTTDAIARLLADKLGRTWNQTVIVENIAGGAMNTGAEHVAKAAPDGYTLMVSPPSPVALNHLLYRDLAYDPRQFVPVAMLAKIPNALVVRNDLPAKDVHELIAYAKANPDKLYVAWLAGRRLDRASKRQPARRRWPLSKWCTCLIAARCRRSTT